MGMFWACQGAGNSGPGVRAPEHSAPPNAASCEQIPDEAPEPAYSGKAASLPNIPQLPILPIKSGNDYTVYGAIHHLRNPIYSAEIQKGEITIEGWISRTNYDEAPRCAVHATGKADPEDYRAPIPAFWVADSAENPHYAIKVMGFAANWAQLYSAILAYRNPNAKAMSDEFWGTPIPRPVPSAGAKIRLRASYGATFTMATSGAESDTRNGILTYRGLEYLQEAPSTATLPGMKQR
jgi:hypothetical protein